MIRFRIETIEDPHSGLIFAELFSDATNTSIARSEPMYKTHDQAAAEVATLIKQAWPDRTPTAVDPSLGV